MNAQNAPLTRAPLPHPQCALAYKKLGIAPIVMSAGELESGNAGEPAKLLRQRYREVSAGVRCASMCGGLYVQYLFWGGGLCTRAALAGHIRNKASLTARPIPVLRAQPAFCTQPVPIFTACAGL